MQLPAQDRWAREVLRYHVLFRRDPEWKDLNIVNRGYEKYVLQRNNGGALDRMFIECINDARIVAGNTGQSPSSYLVP